MTATTVASGEINMPSKHNLICHVAKVKAATSAHSMADVIPFLSEFNIPFESNASKKTQRKIYIIHNKENIIRNISRTSLFQQLLANTHPRLRDSVPIVIWPRGGLGLVTDKKTKKKKTRSCYSNLKPRLYFWLINSFLSQKSRLNLICLHYE